MSEWGYFRPFASRYVNGEVHHLLRDRGVFDQGADLLEGVACQRAQVQSAGVLCEAVVERLGA